jgi:hypothetical protein
MERWTEKVTREVWRYEYQKFWKVGVMDRKEEHVKEWIELSSGLTILYMEPEGKVDEYINRIMEATMQKDIEEMEHISALLFARIVASTDLPKWIEEKWVSLSKEYHEKYCSDYVDE